MYVTVCVLTSCSAGCCNWICKDRGGRSLTGLGWNRTGRGSTALKNNTVVDVWWLMAGSSSLPWPESAHYRDPGAGWSFTRGALSNHCARVKQAINTGTKEGSDMPVLNTGLVCYKSTISAVNQFKHQHPVAWSSEEPSYPSSPYSTNITQNTLVCPSIVFLYEMVFQQNPKSVRVSTNSMLCTTSV